MIMRCPTGFRSTILRFTTIVKIRHCTTDSSYAVERKMNYIKDRTFFNYIKLYSDERIKDDNNSL